MRNPRRDGTAEEERKNGRGEGMECHELHQMILQACMVKCLLRLRKSGRLLVVLLIFFLSVFERKKEGQSEPGGRMSEGSTE